MGVIGFRSFLLEAKEDENQSGQSAGEHEIKKTSPDKFKKLVDIAAQKKYGKPAEDIIPDIMKNYALAQSRVKLGTEKRRDMPVITDDQVWTLQRRLMHGALDIKAPFAPETNSKNPFPEGLSGKQAEEFILRGFHDSKLKDDVISVKSKTKSVRDLKPIQEQMYLSRSVILSIEKGIAPTKNFISKSFMISSKDNYIIDGHHRWLSAIVLDPSLTMPGIEIDLSKEDLVQLLRAYGDAIGNRRNN